jgi:hypothetical protein
MKQPQFEIDSFTDLIYDEDGKGHNATISYEGAYYDGSFRVYKCSVATGYRHVSQLDIEEMLHLRDGKNIVFECKLEIL